MFTGIITEIGLVQKIEQTAQDWKVYIKSHTSKSIKVGGSIACDGICLTIIEKDETGFVAEVSKETVTVTNARFWSPGYRINLEPSLKIGDEISGHLVLGHVDNVARVNLKEAVGDSTKFGFEVPTALMKFIVQKGSICINGVSLTINHVESNIFFTNIIPHTLKHTNFDRLDMGAVTNIEVDMLARYCINASKSLGRIDN